MKAPSPISCRWLLAVGMISVFLASYALAAPKLKTVMPTISPAAAEDALATYQNPAALGFNKVFNLHYLRTYSGPSQRDDALFLAGWGSGVSLEFIETGGVPFNRYTLADGFRLSDHLFLGSSYSWYTSEDRDYDKLRLWQIGTLYRRTYLSLGAVVRNVNRPKLGGERLFRQVELGIALRPGTEALTLSFDLLKQEKVPGWDFRWGMELRPVRGLFLRGRLYEDKSFDIHFGWRIIRFGMGSYNRFDEEHHLQDGVAQFSYAALPYTRRPRQRLLLEVRPDQIVPVLTRARRDDQVVGAILMLDGSNLGLARTQEACEAIRRFKAQGKKVLAYAQTYTTSTYLLAAASDRILLHPSGEVRLVGLRTEAIFAKAFLDKLGVQANVERIGKYKSAAEQLTRNEMSDAFREAQTAVLDDLYDQVLRQLAASRGWDLQEAARRIDQGPYTAWDAKTQGLVNELAYEDQVEALAEELLDGGFTKMEATAYLNRKSYPHTWKGPRPRIALIHARGLITSGESFRDFITGMDMMGAKTMTQAIRQAREDDRVKAVVLRVDSPGGLVVASDAIWHELMLTRDEKPLVVSMGDVAASGGYYIAIPGEPILAEPATLTGSIGVFSGRYNLHGLYHKLGLNKTILKRGAHADFYSDYAEYSEEHRQIVQRQVQQIYQDFITKVARARRLSVASVDAVAQGRIWTGRQALEHGLVDQLGGLSEAIQIAKQKAGLDAKEPVDLLVLPKSRWYQSLIEKLAFQVAPGRELVSALRTLAQSHLWALCVGDLPTAN